MRSAKAKQLANMYIGSCYDELQKMEIVIISKSTRGTSKNASRSTSILDWIKNIRPNTSIIPMFGKYQNRYDRSLLKVLLASGRGRAHWETINPPDEMHHLQFQRTCSMVSDPWSCQKTVTVQMHMLQTTWSRKLFTKLLGWVAHEGVKFVH